MELRHIRYFLAVAEEGNFTRAAARLGIGQPPLSLQIKGLEGEVGTPLFHRVPQGAVLTEAGLAFQQAIAAIPEQVKQAKEAAQRAARGESGTLSISYTATAMLTPIVPGAIRAFRLAYPDVALVLREQNSAEMANQVLAGHLDLAFLRPGNTVPTGLSSHRFPDEPMVAALPVTHPILNARSKQAINLNDLRNDPWVMTPREIGPALHDETLKACREAGFEPRRGQLAPQILSILTLVATGQGVSLVPSSLQRLGIEGVAYRPLVQGKALARLALYYRADTNAVLVRNFLETVMKITPSR